jgi:GntR family transcriptional regulator of arabinose operon
MFAYSDTSKDRALLLEEKLRQDIFTGKLGNNQAITPEMELSERYSISRNSVRKVIKKLVDEGVLYRRQGSGTFVVPDEKRSKHRAVSTIFNNIRQVVFLSMDTALSEECFREQGTFEPTFLGLNQVLQPLGYNLLFAQVHLDWQPPECLVQNDISGIIFHGEVEPEFWNKYIKPYPNVGLHYVNHQFDCDWVKQDNFFRSFKALQYLKEKGHKNIGFVSNEADRLIPRERFQGYKAAQKLLSLPENPDWEICWQRPAQDGVLQLEHKVSDYSEYLEKAFAGKEKPTAFICIDNWRAMGTLMALQKMGYKIPEDISIIGGYISEHPSKFGMNGDFLKITYFDDRIEEICAIAAKVLVDKLASGHLQVGSTVSIKPKLMEGETVKDIN